MIDPTHSPERHDNPAHPTNESAFTAPGESLVRGHEEPSFNGRENQSIAANPLTDANISRPVSKLPLLTLQELSENRLNDLSKLYQDRGVVFNSESELISRIQEDWGRYRALDFSHPNSEDAELQLEPIVVEHGQTSFKIYGAIHSWTSGRDYHDLYNNRIAEHASVVAEQGMGMFFRLPEGGVTCVDWSVISSREYFSTGLIAGFDLRGPLSMIAGMVLSFQKREDEESTANGWHFHNEVDGLPDQIAREIQVSEGYALNFIQRRSQYQAEFSRAWAKEVGHDCAILVGGSHATEIRDYLRYGVDDPDIVERASAHARLAREDPSAYKAMYVYNWACGLALSSVGLAVGLSPWIGLAFGARKLLFGI